MRCEIYVFFNAKNSVTLNNFTFLFSQDIIAGFLYTILILAVFYPFVDLIDNFNQTHKYAPLIIIGLHLALGVFSFTLDTWSTSRGDTAEILGSGAGIACGSHVTYTMGLMLDPSVDMLPLVRPPITVTLFGKAIMRILIGMVFVLIVRNIMKKITIPLACKIFSIPCDDIRKARQHMEVELPYRYITYGMVGFSITFLVPYIFFFIGISWWKNVFYDKKEWCQLLIFKNTF